MSSTNAYLRGKVFRLQQSTNEKLVVKQLEDINIDDLK